MRIKTIIWVEPTPKGRPRSRIVQKKGVGTFIHHYTPDETINAEQMIKALIRTRVMKFGYFEPGVPLRLEATFFLVKPKSIAKKVRLPVKRPDWDNYAKLLTDALNKYVYADDSQITTALIKKRYGSPPRIELMMEEDEV